MELLQLQYFKALAEKNHMTKTAEELFISAPALSASISRLEKELGVKLFDRIGRNIYLNDYGSIYLKHVQNIFASLEAGKQELNNAQISYKKSIPLGVSSTVIWHRAFLSFVAANNDISLSQTFLDIDKLKDTLYCSQFAFVITANSDFTQKGWNKEILIQNDAPLLAVYPGHRFASYKTIDLVEAKDENFITPSSAYSLRRFFDKLCLEVGFRPKIVLECDYLLRSKMLASQYGITVITESGRNAGLLDNAIFVRITRPRIKRYLAIYWNKQRILSKNELAFLDFIMDYFAKQAAQGQKS